MGKKWKQWQALFSWAPKWLWMVTRAIKLKDTCSLGKKAMVSPDSILKKQRHHFVHKVSYIQSYGFSIIHVQMWQLDHKKGWVTKIFFFFWLFEQRCFWTVLLEKTHESPLDNKEIKLVNPKINQSWIFIGRTDGKASVFWPPDVKSQLIGNDPDTAKDWGQEEKGMIEDEMVGWNHWINGHEFEQTLGYGNG